MAAAIGDNDNELAALLAQIAALSAQVSSLDVAAAITAIAPGDVGSFVLASRYGHAVEMGITYPASELRPAGINCGGTINDNWRGSGDATGLTVGATGALSGTWRAHGANTANSTTNFNRMALFQRIM